MSYEEAPEAINLSLVSLEDDRLALKITCVSERGKRPLTTWRGRRSFILNKIYSFRDLMECILAAAKQPSSVAMIVI